MQKNQTKNVSSLYEDDSYLDVSMSIQETIGEILNSEEVRKEILDDLRKKGLDVKRTFNANGNSCLACRKYNTYFQTNFKIL